VTASPRTEESDRQSAAVVYLVIETALSTWVYRSGDQISIDLVAKHGVVPLTWSFANLPAGLFGDHAGRITGRITEAGLYSFSAAVGDAQGNKAQSFYTLNIQPGSAVRSKNSLIQLTTSLMFPTETSLSSMTSIRLETNKLLQVELSPVPSPLLLKLEHSSLPSRLLTAKLRLLLTSLLTKRELLRPLLPRLRMFSVRPRTKNTGLKIP